MVKKSVGYVELEWICPNCGTRNPGPQKTCTSCGYAQPDNVEFQQKAHEELISDEEKIAQAQIGPDVQCAFCGTRNPATAEACSQCGAPLSEGTARQQGKVLGAHRRGLAQPIICPSCGTENDPDEDKCTNCGASLASARPASAPKPIAPLPAASQSSPPWKLIGIAAAVAIALMCGFFIFMANRTEETTGRVEAVEWEREIQIEGLVPVEYETWQSRLPDEATVGQCTMKLYDTQDRPSDGAREVCGTPYTVDKGNGLGEVVQDCQYEVYAEWCEYTVPEWQEIDVLTLSGSDFSPAWPSLALEEDQREGERDAAYRCIFTTEDGKRTYNTDDLDDFMRCQPGSRWVLEVNGLNGVRTIVPDN